jgi:hypothetical protein
VMGVLLLFTSQSINHINSLNVFLFSWFYRAEIIQLPVLGEFTTKICLQNPHIY